ncbi:MAG: hypothetical protein JXB32_22065 [Deltaproteobacteria bacterium]|nr:hypothetical protein [Deltaproteobacteria bacterium]
MPRSGNDRIRLPEERCYYFASRFERDRLLCWVPKGDLARMPASERPADLDPRTVRDGVELVVDDRLLQAMGVRVSLHTLTREVIARLERPGVGPLVGAAEVEARLAELVKSATPGGAACPAAKRAKKAGRPVSRASEAGAAAVRMTRGQDARSFFNRLQRGAR